MEKLVLQWFFRSLFLYLSFSLVSAVSLLKGKQHPEDTSESGVKWKELLTGKMLGLLSLVSLLYFPVIIVSVMLWLSLAGFKVSIDEVTRLLWIILSYFGYFFIISLVCVLVSATSKTSKSSLIKLISIWLLFIVIMPRAAQAFGSYTHPAPSKIDFDTRVESELIKAGDSHNPDDIHYKGIKDSLLKHIK